MKSVFVGSYLKLVSNTSLCTDRLSLIQYEVLSLTTLRSTTARKTKVQIIVKRAKGELKFAWLNRGCLVFV